MATPKILLPWVLFACFALGACGGGSDSSPAPPRELTFDFTFVADAEGWVGGFAEYRVGDEANLEMSFGYRAVGAPLTYLRGMYFSANNRSDDVFMYLKRRLSGLRPNSRYRLRFDIEIASNSPEQCTGIGGAPGPSTFVKAGASLIEPDRVIRPYVSGDYFYYFMNVDKGAQSQGGRDAIVLGHAGVNGERCDGTDPYVLKPLNNATNPFDLYTDATGNAWILVGFDSGSESTLNFYFTRIKVTATEF